MLAKRTFLNLLLILGVTTNASCFLMNLRPQLDVADYRGDGIISKIRSAENPGFTVDFEQFSLAKAYAAKFRLDGLPKPHGATPYEAGLIIGLAATEESQWPTMPRSLLHKDVGTLMIKLEGPTGDALFEGVGELESLNWHKFIGDSPFGSVPVWRYLPDANGNVSDQPWFLVVAYTPGPDSIERVASVRFTAGGRH
ncbi:MAG: hypothetical protein ACRD88_13570 [Terriglobia bacterium]